MFDCIWAGQRQAWLDQSGQSVKHITMLGDWKSAVCIINEIFDQIMVPPGSIHIGQRLWQIHFAVLKPQDQPSNPVFLHRLPTDLDNLEPVILTLLLGSNGFCIGLQPVLLIPNLQRPVIAVRGYQGVYALGQVESVKYAIKVVCDLVRTQPNHPHAGLVFSVIVPSGSRVH